MSKHKLKVGFVGWRGMVGSILIKRMQEENDFAKIIAYFFSTSQKHQLCSINNNPLLDAYNLDELCQMECIITTQGSEYTNHIVPLLKQNNYSGYFIDASSALRNNDDTIIALDPINKPQIINGLNNNIKFFAGGNCSITLSLMGLAGLFNNNLIDSMNMMTYQAASGAGAKNIRELLKQMQFISENNHNLLNDENTSIINLLDNIKSTFNHQKFPDKEFQIPLAGNIIPWIDTDLHNGISKEEFKGEIEANKILNLKPRTIKIDGFCIRVGTIQSHSAAITLTLKEQLPIKELQHLIETAHEWVSFIPNTKNDTLKYLTPFATTGSLKIAVGRLKQSTIATNTYHVITVGDQLLWGAAEPLRRMLNIIIDYINV